MQLLTELADHPDFGRGSWPHQALMNRVALDVARLSGVPVGDRRTPWASVVLALIIGIPLGYWTFKINQEAFHWYSLFPGVIAFLMLMAILGMVFPSRDEPGFDDSEQLDVRPLAGDINARTAVGPGEAPASSGTAPGRPKRSAT